MSVRDRFIEANWIDYRGREPVACPRFFAGQSIV
jgi:hypothetical protein